MNTIGKTALLFGVIGLISACVGGGGSDPTVRSYDFGLASVPAPSQSTVHVREVDAPEWLDRSDILYRLLYRDARAIQPYTRSHWAGTPVSLLTLRLRQTLGNADVRSARCVLSVSLEEFSQVFDSETASRAVLHARANLRQGGDARRSDSTAVRLERPAKTPDAAGAAAALAVLADDFSLQLRDWIAGLGYCQ